MLAVRPDSVPYFYGRITRENAEHILLDRGSNDGMYLLRSSSSLDSEYVLSMCFNKQVLHYRIGKGNDDMYYLCGAPLPKYPGPIELVENVNILPCKLLIPCIKPLHVFMPGVNCGITDEKLQEAIRKKSKEWGLKEEELNVMLEDKENDIWKIILKSLHESEFWFHGKINRSEAEKRLTEHGLESGTFLIREHDERSFSLSLCHLEMVKHYKIDVLSSGEVGIQDGPRFDNIISLVSHYSVFSDGLWCTLQQPCIRSKELDSLNSTMRFPTEIPEAQLGLNNAKRKISSPIAAFRTGLMAKDSNSSLQNENTTTKTSSKSKPNSTNKGSSKKSAVSTWLKNLSRPSHDSKAMDKASKPSSINDNQLTDVSSPALNISDSNKKSIQPPITKESPTSSGLTVDISVPTLVPGSELPSAPSLSLPKDHNHNDCKPSACRESENTPLPDRSPSSPSVVNHKLALEEALAAHLSKRILERNLPSPDVVIGGNTNAEIVNNAAHNSSLDVLPVQNHTSSLKKPKPLPFPRQKKTSCPTPSLPQIEAGVVKETGSCEHIFQGFQFPLPGPTMPTSTTDETASSELLNCCSGPKLLSACNAINVNLNDGASLPSEVSSKPPISKPPRLHVPSNAFNLTSLITELKNRHIVNASEPPNASSYSLDLNVESSSSSPISLVPEVDTISDCSKLPATQNDIGTSVDATTFAEITPVLNNGAIQKDVGEIGTPNDPLYEEIDPEYENNSGKITPSCVPNSALDISDVPTVPSAIYEDSKWEGTRNDDVDPSNPNLIADTLNKDVTSKFSERKKKFSKEQSEFHYKTIKRHRKGPEAIDRKLLCFGEKIGLGHFGHVMKATFKFGKDEVPCAVKTLKRDEIATGKEEILREARIMTSLDHPHIVRLLGICEGEPFLLVMELAPLGSLNDYLKHNSSVPVLDILSLMHQVAIGMEYLESKQFVHRDLAARNVLLVNESFAKISDFGMSKALGLHTEYYKVEPKGKLPLKWYAPECIYFFKFSTKSDVWSYGITLWEALSYGGKPYLGMAGRDILKLFATSERLECPKMCPKEIYQIMLSCWEIRPEVRPTFSKLATFLREYISRCSDVF